MTGIEFLARVAPARSEDGAHPGDGLRRRRDARRARSTTARSTASSPKPWTPEEMRLTLRRGIEVYALDREREQLLRELAHPATASRAVDRPRARPRAAARLCCSRPLIERSRLRRGGSPDLRRARDRALRWEKGIAPRIRTSIASAARPELRRRTRPALPRAPARTASSQPAATRRRLLDSRRPCGAGSPRSRRSEILVVPLHREGRADRRARVDNRRGGRPSATDDQTLLEGLGQPGGDRDRERAPGRGPAPLARAGAPRRPPRHARHARRRARPRDQQPAGLDPHLPRHGARPSAARTTPSSGAATTRSPAREVERIRGLVETMRRLGRGSAHDDAARDGRRAGASRRRW